MHLDNFISPQHLVTMSQVNAEVYALFKEAQKCENWSINLGHHLHYLLSTDCVQRTAITLAASVEQVCYKAWTKKFTLLSASRITHR